jgi:hypothetical protein
MAVSLLFIVIQLFDILQAELLMVLSDKLQMN